MASLINMAQLQKMRRAYVAAFENLLLIKPDLELTQKNALDEDFQRRFFLHIEKNGVESIDLDSMHMRLTAAQLSIDNTRAGWKNFFENRQTGALL